MTAAVQHSSGIPLSVPQTQNTAPVIEFNCLYTHDIRRKQKRWQDGFLRFHTFNRRVMVYDVPRNFIGDTHWKADDLRDGDEVTLEKDGVLVQVAETVGRTETDLTEVRKSKKKSSSVAASSSPARPAPISSILLANGAKSKPATQLKHRSLNALLGTSKGPIGKAALPTKSPFEERYAASENEHWENGRPAKRPRTEHISTWSVTRTTAARSPAKKEAASSNRRTDASKMKKNKTVPGLGQQKLGTKEVIDLSKDQNGDDIESVASTSDIPALPSSLRRRQIVKEPSAVRSSSPAFQTMNLPLAPRQELAGAGERTAHTHLRNAHDQNERTLLAIRKDSHPSVQPIDKPRRPSHSPRSPPRDATRSTERPASKQANSLQVPVKTSTGSLRMAASSSKKKTLLCQDQLSTKPSRVHSTGTENAINVLLDVTSQDNRSAKQGRKSQRKQLEERLARIENKVVSPEAAGNDVDYLLNENPCIRPTSLEDTALELAQLDQIIMPPQDSKSPGRVQPKVPDTRPSPHITPTKKANQQPSQRRVPGAPARFTPTPSPTKTASPKHVPAQQPAPKPALNAKQPKPQRIVSLNTRSTGTSSVILGKPFQTPKAPKADEKIEAERVANPWSREAFDLFTWRPPDWDEANWCRKVSETT